MNIESLLQCGAENALSTAELLELTDFRTARELQKQIAAERERGALILSSTSGYFMPSQNLERREREIRAFIRTLRARALSTLKVLRSASRAVKVSGQQEKIAGW